MNEITKRLFSAIFCIVYSLILQSYSIKTLIFYYVSLTVVCLWEFNGLVIRKFFHQETTYPSLKNIFLYLSGITWICLPMYLCVILSYPHNNHAPELIYVVMTFVFVSDAGAYFVGKRYGKTKLCPTISPKKTLEGAIGGGVISFLCYFPSVYYLSQTEYYSYLKWNDILVIYFISVVGGILGDMLESIVKRKIGVKDAGNILPGHGGVLDRVDGLLLAIPFVFCVLNN